jgi:hypothetical protein
VNGHLAVARRHAAQQHLEAETTHREHRIRKALLPKLLG